MNPDNGPTTSQERFHQRVEKYRAKDAPLFLHHWWWFVHNVVAHPLIGVAPSKPTFQFHDFTSRKINQP